MTDIEMVCKSNEGQVEALHDTYGQPDIITWQPKWIVDVGNYCQVGIATDDNCFVILCPNEANQWHPATHIPIAVAIFLGQLANQ